MGLADDLSADSVARGVGGRPVRFYPALLSTEADAQAWARARAPAGAVVVAGYQASPRGRAGRPWTVRPERDLAFSLVLRPELPVAREGWVYAVAVTGLAHALGDGVTIGWPDTVRRGAASAGAVGAQVELGAAGLAWAVVSVRADDVPRRAAALGRIVTAIEERLDAPVDSVLSEYRARCATLGRRVCARMIPLGPAGPRIEGTAVAVLGDGSLVVRTDRGNRVAVRPQHLGLLDELGPDT